MLMLEQQTFCVNAKARALASAESENSLFSFKGEFQ